MGILDWLKRSPARPSGAPSPSEAADAAEAAETTGADEALADRSPLKAPPSEDNFALALARLVDSADGADAATRVRDCIEQAADRSDALTKIARGARNASIRRAAVDDLDSPAVLIELALEDPDADVRRSAIGGISEKTAAGSAAIVRFACESADT